MAQHEVTFKVSPRILDHLGISAYNNVRRCLAELAANSYDADATIVEISVPESASPSSAIEISDDGPGMTTSELEQHFLVIGRNKRTTGQRSRLGRLLIGSKGIGKCAGFGVASRIEVFTWRDSVESRLLLDRAVLADDGDLSAQKLQITTTTAKHRSGTLVRLSCLNRDLAIPTLKSLRRYLFSALPQAPEFLVRLNGVLCSAADIPGERYPVDYHIPGVGRVIGYMTVADEPQENAGVAVKVRGRMVKEPGFFGIDVRQRGFFTVDRIVGEVSADFFDPETTGVRVGDLINTARNGLLEDAPTVQRFEESMRAVLVDFIDGLDAKERDIRVQKILTKQDIKSALRKLPAHIRPRVEKRIVALVRSMKNIQLDELVSLCLWIIRYYESNVLRELMQAILEAEIGDAELLGQLIEEWGIKQLNGVAVVLKDQLEIIARLQQLVESDHSRELEVHKLIEKNLWLVREGLELWGSDRSLTTLIEGRIDEIYSSKARLRTDLVCRSRDEGKEAVILEFKRPAEVVGMQHVTQALQYDALIRAHRPAMRFEMFVVGRAYDAEVLTSRDRLERAGVHLYSLADILERARRRYEEILRILGR